MARIVWDGKEETMFAAQKVTEPKAEVARLFDLPELLEPSPYCELDFYPEQQPPTVPSAESLDEWRGMIQRFLGCDPFSRSLEAVEGGE